jgi:hypothetical protein
MKNKQITNKDGKLRLIFGVALVCAILFMACNNISDTPVGNGYGRISISLTGGEAAARQSARTVLPLTVFDKYAYVFTREGEEIGIEKVPDNNGFFILEIGNYTVEVQAYIGVSEPYTLSARGVSDLFSVGPGSNDPVEIILSSVDSAEQGRFNYTITYPANATAEIILQRWPDTNVVTLTPNNLPEANGITEILGLKAGSYLLTILVSKDEFYAGIVETVHIYPANVTLYTKVFNSDDMLAMIIPNINDYNISGMGTFPYDGTQKTATITPKGNAALGAITVLYNGTKTQPVNAGEYTVTFNVAAIFGVNVAAELRAGTITVSKASGAAVSAPVLNIKTHNSITVNLVNAPSTGQSVEYGISSLNNANAAAWQTGLIFNGLSVGTTYYIFARATENGNYQTGGTSGSLTVTTLQTASPDRFVYYWVDQHGSLVTTNGGAATVPVDGILTITAQGTGYDVKRWYLDGINTGQSGNTYNFSSTVTGNHTVDLFLEKDGKLYSTSITITVQ